MPATDTIVIVGGGLAGAKAAESLRAWRFDGRVVLVGAEPTRPYERPPLSKGYLQGRDSADDTAVHDAGYYAEHGIELRTATTVTTIDPRAREVVLEPGGRLPYDRLLLATGATPRRLDVPGADLANVFSLRTVADADAIRRAARPGSRALVVGAGWLGGEVTASLRLNGVDVVMVDRGAVPYQRTVGTAIGQVYRDLHAEHGVEVRSEVAVAAFTGAGAITGAQLSDGTRVSCNLAVVGVGVTPAIGLAEAAGITTDNGIVVDQFLQTSAPHVFAAGDVANSYHPTLHRVLRLEHWWAALTQGPVAAANMLGKKIAYDWIPYFGSKQYDFEIEYTGHAPTWDDIVIRGDPASRRFIAFYLCDGRVAAGMNAGVWGVSPHIRRLVAGRRRVDRQQLADPDVALGDLSAHAQPAATRPAQPTNKENAS